MACSADTTRAAQASVPEQTNGQSPSAEPATAMNLPIPSGGIHWSGSPADIEATAPNFGRTENGEQRILLACAMLEDEVLAAYDKHGCDMAIRWIDRGYHENPDVLRAELQKMIDAAEQEGATEILLAIGLCGNGVVGLVGQHARLAIPRFDDCINLMLCCGQRTCRG